MKLQKITTNLWFDSKAEEAARFYTSIFENSSIGRITRYGTEGYEIHGIPEGTVMTVEFRLEGQTFVALNGGRQFKFTEAISFIVHCETQDEIDFYWEKLSEGGDENSQVCGWLKDQYGVSWQVVPRDLPDMLNDLDSEKSRRVMQALMKTKTKIDLNTLKEAYEGW
ncbi:VOC family protein [Fictibacillus barbaricus]|uniref:VOC family protein n=1 Tax=Fictibacillus barbaricus TaxID=182136 RepID=A0ABS2ZCL8_9BACL|nr:VOC family protein [Fictibacillus barbaricus]MBN3545181.1 VOC family protein [Fictibacillus barbaricus]GGB61033.1 VOC family protein [Fictibacillus barbaricus]